MSDANSPRISVVIPCYNGRRTLGAALDSIWAQQHPSLEIVVVDDGSRDGSAAWLRDTHPSVRVVEQANAGVAAARNRGIEEARGQWIAFLDADDVWLPGKLAAQDALLARDPDCRLCYTAWQTWPSDDERPSPAFLEALAARAGDSTAWAGASGWIYPELLLDCVVWTSTVLADRNLLRELGGFDRTLRIGEDYDLWFRASRRTRIERIPHPYAVYRLHPASITRSAPTDNYRAKVISRAIEQWGFEGPDGRRADLPAVQRGLAKSWVDYGAALLATGQPGAALRAARQAMRHAPAYGNAWKLGVRSVIRRFA